MWQVLLFTAATVAALAAAWTVCAVVGTTGAACMAAVRIGSGIAGLLLFGEDVNLLLRKTLLRREKTRVGGREGAAVRAGPLFRYGKGETVKCRNKKSWWEEWKKSTFLTPLRRFSPPRPD